mmetsp:Transcript_7912/g.19894  ORF Transcript_7912/g.19894 Transcript_7912/m.19894 type:complete len:100 (-) Transcript_7912:774-1073(-)
MPRCPSEPKLPRSHWQHRSAPFPVSAALEESCRFWQCPKVPALAVQQQPKQNQGSTPELEESSGLDRGEDTCPSDEQSTRLAASRHVAEGVCRALAAEF